MREDILDLFDMIIAYHMNASANRTGIASDIKNDVFKLFDQGRVEKMAVYFNDMFAPKAKKEKK